MLQRTVGQRPDGVRIGLFAQRDDGAHARFAQGMVQGVDQAVGVGRVPRVIVEVGAAVGADLGIERNFGKAPGAILKSAALAHDVLQWSEGDAPVAHVEVMPRMRHQLIVRGMVDRFHRDHPIKHLRVVAVQVFDEPQLGLPRPGNQNFMRVAQRLCYGVVEMFIFLRLARADGVGLVMQMLMRVRRVHDGFAHMFWIDEEHMRLVVVDPDRGVFRRIHGIRGLGRASDIKRESGKKAVRP